MFTFRPKVARWMALEEARRRFRPATLMAADYGPLAEVLGQS